MSKPKRRRRPSMYQSAAKIRRKARSILDKEIHEPTGLPYGTVQAVLSSEFRYCLWWKGKNGRKHICCMSPGDGDDDLALMAHRKKLIQISPVTRNEKLPDMEIGLIEIRHVSSARTAAHRKVQKWLKSPNPNF